MAKISSIVLLVMGLSGSSCWAGSDVPWMLGADVSSLEQVEESGGRFTVAGRPVDPLRMLKAHGVGLVRLRLWREPADGRCDLESVADLATRADALGFDILLDLHYSDTWTDPAHQAVPAAWAGLSFAALLDSVRAHARDAVAILRARGATPTIVQLGNEISSGMLWDHGRVGGRFDGSERWAARPGRTSLSGTRRESFCRRCGPSARYGGRVAGDSAIAA